MESQVGDNMRSGPPVSPSWTGGWRWWVIGLVLLLPLVVAYDRTEPARIMENLSVMSSQDTWLRVHAGEEHAWLVPSWNGRPRINKPPLLVWMNLLAWSDLTPDTAPLETLVARARLVAVGFAVLALCGVYGAGRTLFGDRDRARLAAAMTGTMLLFVKQTHYAAYDTHLLGWLTLSVAVALHALAPRAGAAPPRRAPLFWALAGLLLAGAWMTKGPLALALGLGPLAALATARPAGRRAGAWAGLLGMTAVAAALVLPWYLYVIRTVPDAVQILFFEYRAVRNEFQPPWYYLGLVGLVFPWTVPWLRGLLTPRVATEDAGASSSPVAARGPRWNLAWLWFAFIFIFMSIPGAKQQRYILPILPAAGLLAAAAWMRVPAEADARRREHRWMRVHFVLMALVAVLGPLFLVIHDVVAGTRLLPKAVIAGVSPLAGVVLWGLLAPLVWRAWKAWQAGRRLPAALMLVTGWSLLSAVLGYGYNHANHGAFREKHPVFALDDRVGDTPLFYVPRAGGLDPRPSKELLMYTRRVVPALPEADLREKLRAGDAFYVLVRQRRAQPGPVLRPAPEGLVWLLTVDDGEKEALDLYRSAAARETPGAAPRPHPYADRFTVEKLR